jgi:hypothetical protein
MQRRTFRWCSHDAKITTITAGLAREVCETCARVSVRYVEQAVQVYPTRSRSEPTISASVEQARKDGQGRCRLCRQPAEFMIPGGMTCNEHAWQAAARLDWDATDPWVPIRIDKSNA